MNIEVNMEEIFTLIDLLCNEQVRLVREFPKQEIYKSKKYLTLEGIKIKLKEVM